jgi:hypothetical protein
MMIYYNRTHFYNGNYIHNICNGQIFINVQIFNFIFQHFLSNQTNSESETQNSLKLLGQKILSN